MRVEYVEMSGFRGFKSKTRLNLPRGFAVFTGRNGVGKSTVFDAMDFALTGSISKYEVRVAKGGGLEDHIWWVGDGTATDHYVSVGFVSDDGEQLQITRSRDGSANSEQLAALADRLCLDKAVNPNWEETLMATTLIRDERISALSLDLTEQARFTAVRAALGASDASPYEERSKEILRFAKAFRDEQAIKHSKIHEELGRALSSLTEARSSAVLESDLASAVDRLRRSLASSQSETPKLIAEARSFLIKERQNVIALRTALAAADRLTKDNVRTRLADEISEQTKLIANELETRVRFDAAQIEAAGAAEMYEEARSVDERASAHLALLDLGAKVGLDDGKCPLCETAHSPEEYASIIADTRAILAARAPSALSASQYLAEKREAVASLEREHNGLRTMLASIAASVERRTREVQQIERDFELLGLGTIDDTTAATQILISRQEVFSTVEETLFILENSRSQDRVSNLEARVEQLRSLVEAEAARLNDVERSVEIAQQADKTVRQVANELLSEQFDTVLPLLKELYRRLRPHADWSEIEIDIAGKLRASLNFTVGEGYNPQFLFSSGQRRAAGLAFLLAVHLSRPWCALNTLMLDDPIQHIDDYRSLNLVEVLSAIRRSGRQVIIAVEDRALADVLCRRLRSSSEQPGVRLEFGTNQSGSAEIQSELSVPPFKATVFGIAEAS